MRDLPGARNWGVEGFYAYINPDYAVFLPLRRIESTSFQT